MPAYDTERSGGSAAAVTGLLFRTTLSLSARPPSLHLEASSISVRPFFYVRLTLFLSHSLSLPLLRSFLFLSACLSVSV